MASSETLTPSDGGTIGKPAGGRRRPGRTPKGRQVDPQARTEVQALLGTRSRQRDLLIEHLHLIQDHYGHLSAAHLAGLLFPPGLRRLYVIRDNDPAGRRADAALTARAQAEGIEALTLAPALKDLNDDLRHLGTDALAASVQLQLAPEDVTGFWMPAARDARLRSAWSGATAEGSAVSVD